MRIRPERPEDRDAIFAVEAAAFGREDHGTLVDEVRGSDAFIPELSLVADDGGEIVGHVLVSYFEVVTETGEKRRVLQLGPIGVRPDRQGAGIGSDLVRAAVAKADELGEPLVLLEGAPAYYGRFGFEPALLLGLVPPAGVPEWAFQVLTLAAYDPALRGSVHYPPAFAKFLPGRAER